MIDSPFDQSLVPAGLLAIDLEALADQFGTPLFVYDEDYLRTRCREYLERFGAGNVAYAGKAFLCLAMARLVADEGLNLDVADHELDVAALAGVASSRLVLHGNNKSKRELDLATDMQISRVVADSFDELDRLARANFAGEVLIRVTPGIEAHTHEFIQTGTERSKFGFSVSNGLAAKAVRRVTESGMRFGGLHCHIGSQILDLDSFAKMVPIVTSLAGELEDETGMEVSVLNLGGGLGVRYLSEDPEISVSDYANVLKQGVGGRTVMVEPGRSIAGPAAVTLYRVGTVKENPGVSRYVAVDGGMSDNPRPILYGAQYETFVPSRIGDRRPYRAAVAGRHCEQGDVLVADARLPDVAVGDLLAVPVTGAYGYSMASNYNKTPRPAVVFVSNGNARLVVRRETIDDLVRLDVS